MKKILASLVGLCLLASSALAGSVNDGAIKLLDDDLSNYILFDTPSAVTSNHSCTLLDQAAFIPSTCVDLAGGESTLEGFLDLGDLQGAISGGSQITDDTIREADLKVVDTPSDEECLTYEATGGDFEWQSCGGAGLSDSDYGDITVSGSGTVMNIDASAVGSAEIATDAVSADELNATGVESELEAVLDLADLQGNLTGTRDISITGAITATQAGSASNTLTVTDSTLGANLLEIRNDSGGSGGTALGKLIGPIQGSGPRFQIAGPSDSAGRINFGINSSGTPGFGLGPGNSGRDWFICRTGTSIASIGTSDSCGTLATIVTGDIELGNSSDTTLHRSGAGAATLEGSQIITAGNAAAQLESTLEGVMDLPDLQGAISGGTQITDNTILEADLKAVDTPADEECLTYEATGGDFEWQACGSGGGGGLSDGDYGDVTVSGTGTVIDIDASAVGSAEIATDAVSADELNATGVESELEAVLDLADLQGDLTGTRNVNVTGDVQASDDVIVGDDISMVEGASIDWDGGDCTLTQTGNSLDLTGCTFDTNDLSKVPREKLTANRTYYVRTDGSDSNDGLSNSAGGAFLTVQKAADVAGGLDLAGLYYVTINIADGTYADPHGLALSDPVNAPPGFYKGVQWVGNTTTPANVVIKSSDAFWRALYADSTKAHSFTGVEFQPNSSSGTIACNDSCWLDLISPINIVANSSTVYISNWSQVQFLYGSGEIVWSGNSGTGIVTLGHSRVYSAAYFNFTGTPDFSSTFFYVDTNSYVYWFFDITGSSTGKSYTLLGQSSILFDTGTDPAPLPGDTAGTCAGFSSFTNASTVHLDCGVDDELLAAIEGVDGSGSGLDADLLDGISSAGFLQDQADTVDATNLGTDSVGADELNISDAESEIEGAIDTLANLTSVQGLTVTLADAGADRLFGWDDSAGAYQNLSAADARTILNVEDGADVTDATNVDAAGAVMNSDTSTASMSFVVDEDDMASNSATKVPTQQSVKAYVDANAGGTGTTGTHDMWIPAGAWMPEATAGCAPGTFDSGSGNIQPVTCDFDGAGTTIENADTQITFPKSTDESVDLTADVVWTSSAGSGTVKWQLSCTAASDDDVLNATLPAADTATDTLTSIGDVQKIAISAITVQSWAEGDIVFCRVSRDPANDTNTSDARLLGVNIHYTTNAENDN